MAGIVLAGGQSRRMGADKALLPFATVSMIRRVIDSVRSVTGRVIIVADCADHFGSDDMPESVEVAADRYPGTGPLGGLVTGLILAGPGHHIVVACDMPNLRRELLSMLLERISGYDATVPEVAGRLEPLCAAYDSCCVDRLKIELAAGRLGLQKAVSGLRVVLIPESELRSVDPDLVSFTNVNTPEEYVRALASG